MTHISKIWVFWKTSQTQSSPEKSLDSKIIQPVYDSDSIPIYGIRTHHYLPTCSGMVDHFVKEGDRIPFAETANKDFGKQEEWLGRMGAGTVMAPALEECQL